MPPSFLNSNIICILTQSKLVTSEQEIIIIFCVSYIYLSKYLTSVNWKQICSHKSTVWDTPRFSLLLSLHDTTSLLPSQKDNCPCPTPPKQNQDRMSFLLPELIQASWFHNSKSSRPFPSKPVCGCCFPYRCHSLTSRRLSVYHVNT